MSHYTHGMNLHVRWPAAEAREYFRTNLLPRLQAGNVPYSLKVTSTSYMPGLLPADLMNCQLLQSLHLENMPFEAELPPELALSEALHTLHLQLPQLPAWVANIGTLRTLIVDGMGELDDQNAGIRLECVHMCARLESLRLRHVHLIPPGTLRHLTHLQITHSYVATLPAELTGSVTLREFRISHCWSLKCVHVSMPRLELLHLKFMSLDTLSISEGHVLHTLWMVHAGVLTCPRLQGTPALRDLAYVQGMSSSGPPHGSEAMPLHTLSLMTVSRLSDFAQIATLTHLTLEDLGLYDGTRLHEEIGLYTALRYLELTNVSVNTLPFSFARLVRLETVVLRKTGVSALPDTLADLPMLHNITIEQSTPCTLPSRLPHLRKLIQQYLPSYVTVPTCPELQEMTVQKTEVDMAPWFAIRRQWTRLSLPTWPAGLTHQNTLTHLECSSATLTALPAGPVDMPVLKVLSLQRCVSLTSLPAWVGSLSALCALDVTHCTGLCSLPPEIGNLRRLESLQLHRCGVVTLPETLVRLRALWVLDLRHCYNLHSYPVCFAEFLVVLPYATHIRMLRSYVLPTILALVVALRRKMLGLPWELWMLVVGFFKSTVTDGGIDFDQPD